jgi:hypothetical protein
LDILNDLLYLVIAAIFFTLSFGLIAACGNLMGEKTTTKESGR